MTGEKVNHEKVAKSEHLSAPAKLLDEALSEHGKWNVVIKNKEGKTITEADAIQCRTGSLYDMSKAELSAKGSEPTQKEVYLHLNEIMKVNGFKPAKLENKEQISDKYLPKSWNSINSKECFIKPGVHSYILPKQPPFGTQE